MFWAKVQTAKTILRACLEKKRGGLRGKIHLIGSYSICDAMSVASNLKMTGRNPSLQLQIAVPGFRIQSP